MLTLGLNIGLVIIGIAVALEVMDVDEIIKEHLAAKRKMNYDLELKRIELQREQTAVRRLEVELVDELPSYIDIKDRKEVQRYLQAQKEIAGLRT